MHENGDILSWDVPVFVKGEGLFFSKLSEASYLPQKNRKSKTTPRYVYHFIEAIRCYGAHL
ncbi:hypothetical protein CCP3SC1_690018 [Gammaproteobacteria bacterium]